MQAAYQKLHVGEIQISLRLPFRETAFWQKCGGGSREAWLCRQSPSTHPPPSIAAVKRNERRIKAFSRPTWRREEKEERVDGSDVETAMSYPPVRGMNRSYPLTASHRVPPPPSPSPSSSPIPPDTTRKSALLLLLLSLMRIYPRRSNLVPACTHCCPPIPFALFAYLYVPQPLTRPPIILIPRKSGANELIPSSSSSFLFWILKEGRFCGSKEVSFFFKIS